MGGRSDMGDRLSARGSVGASQLNAIAETIAEEDEEGNVIPTEEELEVKKT